MSALLIRLFEAQPNMSSSENNNNNCNNNNSSTNAESEVLPEDLCAYVRQLKLEVEEMRKCTIARLTDEENKRVKQLDSFVEQQHRRIVSIRALTLLSCT